MFGGKIDKFTEFDNQISNLNSNKLEHLNEIKKIEDEITNKEERLNYGLKYYLEKEKRENLLNGDADKILDQLRVRRFICILTKTASVL